MNDDQTSAMDTAIFNGHVLKAVMVVRDARECGIHAAIEAVAERYEHLRVERPEDFTVPRAEWGKNFYS